MMREEKELFFSHLLYTMLNSVHLYLVLLTHLSLDNFVCPSLNHFQLYNIFLGAGVVYHMVELWCLADLQQLSHFCLLGRKGKAVVRLAW